MIALSAFDIVLIVVAALVLVLAVGGAVANARRYRDEERTLRALAEDADHRLADAHAEDKGWERAGLEEAARRAFAERHPGEQVEALTLVQVVDRPGTDEDEAVFHVAASGGARTLRLARRGDTWIAHQG